MTNKPFSIFTVGCCLKLSFSFCPFFADMVPQGFFEKENRTQPTFAMRKYNVKSTKLYTGTTEDHKTNYKLHNDLHYLNVTVKSTTRGYKLHYDFLMSFQRLLLIFHFDFSTNNSKIAASHCHSQREFNKS